MATSLLRRRCKYLSPVKLILTPIRNGYVVLLPEVPTDTAESNPLLRTGDAPKFNSINAENCSNGVGKRVIEYQSGLCRLEEQLQDPGAKKDFSTVLEPLEKLLFPLDYAWSTVKNLFMLQHTNQMLHVYKTLHPRVQKSRAERFQSVPIHRALKAINSSSGNRLTEVQQRIIDKYLLEARLNGLELSGHGLAHFKAATNTIVKESEKFRIKLNEATKRFKRTITDYSMVKDFPDVILRQMAHDSANPNEGPWRVTLHPLIVSHFMQSCSDRDARWNIWRAYNSRASAVSDSDLNNSIHMEEIRFHRRDLAKLLGYSSYAELSMETKMAGSIENVQAMITSLRVRSKPMMEREIGELQEFAVSQGFNAILDAWDVPYWRRKQAQELFGINEEELRRYFPLPHVLEGLFKLCGALFGITIKDATAEVEVWDSGVSYHDVLDENGVRLGSFYLDPYYRPKKVLTAAALECGINRCDSLGVKPLAFLVFSFQPPIHGLPSLLSFANVISLFEKFGSTLQHVLTRVPYSEAAGMTNVEWDAIDVCGKFMSFWLNDVRTLGSLTRHHETKQQLPADVCSNVIRARKHLAAYDLNQELYRSALDLEFYTRKDFWLDITRELWPGFVPFPLNKDDVHPCSFSQIFTEEYPAAYFSSKWAEMIAADVFSAFEEVGLDDEEKMKEIGQRFRDTFLSLGGGCHPGEVFRRFRGRDPSPDALLDSVVVAHDRENRA